MPMNLNAFQLHQHLHITLKKTLQCANLIEIHMHTRWKSMYQQQTTWWNSIWKRTFFEWQEQVSKANTASKRRARSQDIVEVVVSRSLLPSILRSFPFSAPQKITSHLLKTFKPPTINTYSIHTDLRTRSTQHNTLVANDLQVTTTGAMMAQRCPLRFWLQHHQLNFEGLL